MKTFLSLALACTLFISAAFIPGESCETYFANKVGTKFEQTNYDAKGKVTSVTEGTVKSYDAIDGGFASTINMIIKDAKGKESTNGDVTMKCQDDKFYMDMSNMFPKDMAAIEGAEIEIDNGYTEFPADPVAGQTMPDQTSTMTVKMNGTTFMTMTMKTTNRKIDGFESVTTPAGTYDCVKYSSDTEVKSMFTMKSHSVMWMSKNVGVVKMENYDDKGKLQGSQLLTKFTE